MENEPLLMIPGPVPMPERVRLAMSRQAINHRGTEFGEIYTSCITTLKKCFGTENDLFVLSGSGTAAMEAAVANFATGTKTACLVNGKFGDRLFRIAQRYGKAQELASEWGSPLDLEALSSALEAGAEVVTMVHNETSTGIKNPAREIAALARKHGALCIMDGITSIGGDEVRADRWGVDVAIVGSQKCLAAPAGLSAISVSERAWESLSTARPYYLDLESYRKSCKKSPAQTPYTPAVPLFFALAEACAIIEEEGLEQRIARHRKGAEAIRAAAEAWGLSLFPKTDVLHHPSNTVTAISIPEGISDTDLRGGVKKLGIIIAGGQDHLKGRIFRIGSMGAVSAPEILATLGAVQHVLLTHGVSLRGDGVGAAAGVLG